MRLMDTDHHGKLQKEEAPAPLMPDFDMIDSNGDGSIDTAEAERAQAMSGQN